MKKPKKPRRNASLTSLKDYAIKLREWKSFNALYKKLK
tara:strand:+ start:122 stop:235 length:114 start_codon:yes stop_codon:yes gene_type:complete